MRTEETILAVQEARPLPDREALGGMLAAAVAPVLAAYGLAGARVRLLERKTNVTFRVDAGIGGVGEPERYLLRVCQAGVYDREELASEGTWLRALRAEGLVVPDLVAALDGSPVTSVVLPGRREPRWCVLLRWVPGDMVESAVEPGIIEQVGELGARIHNCSERFVPPPGFRRPRWDCDRLFGRGAVIPAGRGEPLITRRTREILDAAAALLRREIEGLGEGSDVFGLIHKDLEPDNTVLHEGRVHAIDFADCGWGHYLYDIAASLLPLREKKGYPELREAFLRGYRRHRPLPSAHEALIDTFLLARSLFTIRFMVLTSLDERPELRGYAERVIPMMVGEIRRFVERQAQRPGRSSVVQLLAALRDRGVKLWAEGEKLRLTAPPAALTPELKAEVADRKAEILAFLRQGQAAAPAAGPARRSLAEGDPVPLSFAQQRLWFLDQLNPGSAEYNVTRAVRLSGALHAGVLRRAAGEVVRRHAVLRTTFGTVDGLPVQVVAPALGPALPVIDLRRLPTAARLAEARRLIDREGKRPFDLACGPLLRLCLLRLEESEHLIGSSMHHIVSDGWSTGLLFREMGVLYEAFRAGRSSPLPELPIQYADFALWQRGHLTGEVLAAQLAWWTEHLAGAPETLDLPTDRPRTAVRTSRAARCPFVLSGHAAEALRAVAQAEGATLFMVLFAAWNVLLSRLSGQESIVLGIPIANRNRTEIEGLIGFFVNTLALRTDLSGEPAWGELLGRVRRATLGAYDHQDLPFERLVEELRPERALAANPLFQVMFALQAAQREESLALPGLTMSPSPLGSEGGPAKFDLTLSLSDGEGGLRGAFEYRAELFDATTVQRLAGQLATLLEAAGGGGAPGQVIRALPILTAGERQQLTVEWNDGGGEPPGEITLPGLLAAQAARTPEAVAVAGCGGELSFAALERKAGRLAQALRRLGVGPEAVVALHLERSQELVIAMLATLKAGGAYMPLDPSLAEERRAFQLADSRAAVVLTQVAVPQAEEAGVRVLLLQPGWEAGLPEMAEMAAGPAPAGLLPEHPAYVLYTSGSTGRPKGVVIPHRGLVNHMLWMQESLPLTADDRVFQKTPPHFDASVWEIWAPLLAGARLVLARPDGHRDADYLAAAAGEHGVTVLQVVPTLLRVLLEEGRLARCRTLRRLCVGGEALTADLRDGFFATGLAAELVNLYGPTEATIETVVARFQPGFQPDDGLATAPIGRPIANTRVWLLDRFGAPVAAGAVGHLHLAGIALGRGYLRRPDLTAAAYVPDPFGPPGARLYRTGDLARWRPDGMLEYLGRIDHQVKIRGLRVELGEIEAALARQPEVRDAVVLVRGDGIDDPGGKRLVAYVVLRPEARLDAAGLRTALRGSLPDSMLPADYVILPAFPVNASGKVDRRALAQIAPAPTAAATGSEPPPGLLDPAEELLAGIWADVLHLDRVGREDDFFALGGHSLLATQVVSRVRRTFGVELPLQRLFESSTLAGLAAAVRAAGQAGRTVAALVTPVPRDGALPLSFAQQRLWFLDQLQPESPAYIIPAAVRLEGVLDPTVLRAALRQVVRRHEILRTTFAARGGEPVQVIAADPPLPLPLVDLGALPAAAREAVAAELARAAARRPFDLAAGPLVRAVLLRFAEREHAALVSFHHIVADGWSLGVFLGELGALYAALSAGETDPLPALPVQYADFAVWQRRFLQEEVLAEQLAYWRGRLAGAAEALELPVDRPRSAVRTSRAGELAFDLGAALTGRLLTLARGERVTLFMVLFAAWNALLAQVSGQEDLVVGIPVAGRNRREIEGLIGFFVNTLALRTSLGGDPPFSELLGRVREATLGAYAHQDLPFEAVVAELRPDRALAANPLFQVLFTLQNAPRGELALPGLTLSTPPTPGGGAAKFDLLLSLMESGSALRGTLEYRAELFDRPTVARLLRHFRALLETAAADPGRRLSGLETLSGAERHQLLVDWNDTAGPDPGRCLHELFAAQARQAPGAVAVSAADGERTYGELAARSGRLAHRLRALGVGPETCVGLCLPRSAQVVEAMLAVLTAGGAFVPLDPSYPAERLEHMTEDAGLHLLLSDAATVSRLPELRGTRTVLLDRLAGEPEPEAEAAALPAVQPDNLAYVMFTSGSTGRPKGVAVPHRAVARLVLEANYARLAGETFLQLAPLAFDASTLEIWGCLLNGGRLVIPPEGRLSLAELGRWIAQGGVTTLWLTAGLFHQMAEEGQLAALRPLRQLLAGGDALSPAHVRRVLAELPGLLLINGYGPTENTTFTACHVLRRPDEVGETVPIGRPVTGTRTFVLDRRLSPSPLAVVGELYAAGEGLARGYAGRPDLTAERFVPHPCPAHPGERLYQTGDLARLRADGTLEFLGRRDLQVKIRGFRIELGEVEAALACCPGVREAAVLVREEAPGDKRLVAYVARSSPESLEASAAELRSRLTAKLPEPMLPSAFVFLDALPLRDNGKVDRRALARIAPAAPDAGGGAAGPREALAADPAEELLAGIWAEVLRRDRIGRDEDFFALGGHSLLATQVISRVREAFQVELPLQCLFERPTVAGLAGEVREALRAAGSARAAAAPPPVLPVPRASEPPLSFAQQRLWFLDQLQPGSPAYNIPAAVRLRGPLDVPALAAAAAEVVRRHESLRTTFASRAGEPVQVIAPALALEVPLVDLAALPAAERAAAARRLAGEEARRPFDLQTGPLLRFSLLRLEEDEHAALVSFHHIVSDGWSMGVFLGELAALYAAFARREPSPLAGLPVQYADFAHWQRTWLRGEVLAAELRSWTERLAGMPQALELPTDRPRPAVQSARGRSLTVAVPPELTAALARLGRREGVTPFMTLVAVFQALLGRLAGQEGVAVGTPIAGRNRREIEGLIGCFVNTLVLYTDLSGEPSVRGLLGRVRRVALHGYAHQDLPFERLVEELQPRRDMSLNPLFQVLFALQNAPFGARELPGLRLEPVEAESGTAKLDLSLSLREWQGGLRGSLESSADLFDAATPERWWQSFLVLLAAAAGEPERRLSDLPWLTPAERHQLLAGWNSTGSTGSSGLCLHGLVAAQAARTPGAVALVCGGEALTYRELEERAEALARVLRSRGVGPEERVGVCLERGLDLIAALLGVLKAGGAYVPLDPAYPAERLGFMIADAGGRLLVTRESFLDRLPASGVEVLCLEKGLPAVAGETPGWREPAAGNLAYLIYTSGSTGRPKGVAIEHRSAVAMVRWARGVFSDEELAGVLASTSVCFDLSVFEIFVPLAWGGRVILADSALDLAAPAPLAAGTEVRLVNTVPSALAELVRLGALPATVRTVSLAGEALQGALVEAIYRQETVRRVYNLYGPSEDTTYSTFVRVERGSGEPAIGVPLTGTRAYVLDRRLEPVPVGAPGELLLGGEGLARGYLGRPEKTAEVFVPDPFGGGRGERLYRTGDLVRRLAGGELRYLGRLDHQVKVRGFRIELGEIEAVLARCPGVRECAVLVREETPGDKRLVAYVVDSAAGELRAALRASLPEHMLPSAFVFLDALPRTANGKVDRRALALRAPEEGGVERSGERIAPRDALELQLAGLWEELLGAGPVGVRDDFFALGGHSLLGVRLLARIRERCGRTLPLAALMQRPTIEGLAAELRRGASPVRREALVPIRPEGARPPLCLVHPIGGNVLCYADLARRIGAERAIYGLQVPDPVDAAVSLEERAARYVEAARAVHPGGPWLLGGWSLGGVIAFEMAYQLAAAGEEVGLLALIDAYAQGLGPQAGPGTGPAEAVDEAALVPLFVRDLEGLLGMPLPLPHGELRALPPEEALRQVLAEVRRRGLQPPDVGEEDLRSLFAMFRANAFAFRRYVPRPYAGRLTLFRAGDWAAEAALDPSLGWSRVVAGGPAAIEAVEVPGSHYTLLRGEAAAFLAGRLRERLVGVPAS